MHHTSSAQNVVRIACGQDQDCRGTTIECDSAVAAGDICSVYCQLDESCIEATIKGPTEGILTVYCGDPHGRYAQQCDNLRIDAANSLYVNITAGYNEEVLRGLYVEGPVKREYVSTLDCGTINPEYINQCYSIAQIRSAFDLCQWNIKFPKGFAERIFPSPDGMRRARIYRIKHLNRLLFPINKQEVHCIIATS